MKSPISTKFLLLIVGLAVSAFQSHAVDVSINLTRSGASSEAGFTNWEAADNTLPPGSLSVSGLTLSVVDINAGPNLRSIDRGGDDGYAGPLANLTQTWWGQRQSSTGPGGYITIEISSLAAGSYSFTSWHLDHEDQTGGMKVEFSNDDGANFTDVVPAFDLLNFAGGGSIPVPPDNAAAPYEASFNFVSTGTDVQIRFTNIASANSSEAFSLVNGFEIAVNSDPFTTWADSGTLPGTVTFEGDLNGDGVQDGIAFLLGVANPDDDATDALPAASENGSGGLVLTFDCLAVGDRGGAQLRVAHSNTLAGWTATTDVVPDADGTDAGGVVSYVVDTVSVDPLHRVTATIDSGAASGGRLFGRLEGTE